jgi:hypothetical protein
MFVTIPSPCVGQPAQTAALSRVVIAHIFQRFGHLGGERRLLSRFADFANNYCRSREVGSDFKRAAERFDVAARVADMHVSTLFKLRYGRLAHRKGFGHFLLREWRALRSSSSVITSRSAAAFVATRARRFGMKFLVNSLKGLCPLTGSTFLSDVHVVKASTIGTIRS